MAKRQTSDQLTFSPKCYKFKIPGFGDNVICNKESEISALLGDVFLHFWWPSKLRKSYFPGIKLDNSKTKLERQEVLGNLLLK